MLSHWFSIRNHSKSVILVATTKLNMNKLTKAQKQAKINVLALACHIIHVYDMHGSEDTMWFLSID